MKYLRAAADIEEAFGYQKKPFYSLSPLNERQRSKKRDICFNRSVYYSD